MTQLKDDTRVHAAHCCRRHGCKYWESDCPVVAGQVRGLEGDGCEECADASASLIHWVTDIREGETDILAGTTGQPLTIQSIDGVILLALTRPGQQWTHDYLCSLPLGQLIGEEALNGGVSAYIGTEFVGSTEV